MNLIELNIDCLLRIFKYCSQSDLQNLCLTHPILCRVIEDNMLYVQTRDMLMVGHRNRPKILERTQYALSYLDRFRIGQNWLKGRYREHVYFRSGQLYATKLHLDHDSLFITRNNYLRKHLRARNYPLDRRIHIEISSRNTKTDISHFVKKNDTIFMGQVCGNAVINENQYSYEQQLHPPREYLYCVEFSGNVYATSTDRCCKLWRRADELGLIHLDLITTMKKSYKTLRFNTSGDRLYGGLYTDVGRRALREIVIETGAEHILNSNTLSIYDLKFKDDNVLFTANFDTTFRMYDRRTNRDECIWEDPCDSSFFCLEHDGLYAVLCGAKYHGRVNLYDIRVPKKHIQLYFPHQRRQSSFSSPVYSIACDSRYLFIGASHNLYVYDFKTNSDPTYDYSNIFIDQVRFRQRPI